MLRQKSAISIDLTHMPGPVADAGGRNEYLTGIIGTSRQEQWGDQAIITQGTATILQAEGTPWGHEIEALGCVWGRGREECSVGTEPLGLLNREVWAHLVFWGTRRSLKCLVWERRKNKCGWSMVWEESGEAADREGTRSETWWRGAALPQAHQQPFYTLNLTNVKIRLTI